MSHQSLIEPFISFIGAMQNAYYALLMDYSYDFSRWMPFHKYLLPGRISPYFPLIFWAWIHSFVNGKAFLGSETKSAGISSTQKMLGLSIPAGPVPHSCHVMPQEFFNILFSCCYLCNRSLFPCHTRFSVWSPKMNKLTRTNSKK